MSKQVGDTKQITNYGLPKVNIGDLNMNIDTGVLGVVVTLLLALLSLSAWTGALSQKVKRHDDNYLENRSDHKLIFEKLEEINRYLRNGH